MTPNPFTERGRITDPRHFTGRWRELSAIVERLGAGRPVLIAGPPGIGKSSLLTHIAQSAAVNLERDEIESFYVDLAVLPDAAACYRLLVEELRSRGDSAAALEVALIEYGDPVLLCLDGAERAIAAGWGEGLIESLARTARRGPSAAGHRMRDQGGIGPQPTQLLLAVAVSGAPPKLSEPLATVTLGAIAAAEVRLFAEAYLDDTDVAFTPAELRELAQLSAGHPAYLQRAAYHLFRGKTEPGYGWRAAYLEEARDQPVLGAPLPPAAFEGGRGQQADSSYGEAGAQAAAPLYDSPRLEGVGSLLAALLPPIVAMIAWQLSASWAVGIMVLLAGVALVIAIERRRKAAGQKNKDR